MNIQIKRDRMTSRLFMNQTFYIDKLVVKFNINTIDKLLIISLSIDHLIKSKDETISQQIHVYQQKIKFINFIVVIIRFDIVFVVLKLSEFFISSFIIYIKLIDRILKYLKQIKHLEIEFNIHENNQFLFIFLASSDVLFVDDISIKYSFQKYNFRLFDDLID